MASGQVSPKRGKIVDLPIYAPTIGTATDGGNGTSANVAFTAPASTTPGGPIFYYKATSNPGSFAGTASSSPITVSGLTADTSYTFTVTGVNGTGEGPASSASNSVTPALPNSYEAIATLSGNSSSQVITFTSIPGTYKSLQIRGTMVADYGSSDYGNAGLRFNGDSGLNYANHVVRGYWDGSTGNQQGVNYTIGTANYGLNLISFLNQSQDTVFPVVVDIYNYADTNNTKIAKATSGSSYWNYNNTVRRGIIQGGSMFWNSTAAITSISLYQQNAPWNPKTKFTLYGIKDS